MDISIITLILTSFTALAAVIGPIISSVITIRSNERTKRFEIYSPQLFEAVRKFSDTYSHFPRGAGFESYSDHGKHTHKIEIEDAYKEFAAAAYELISLMADPGIQAKISELLTELEHSNGSTSVHDSQFQEISAAIAEKLASEMSQKKNRIARKGKRDSSK